MKILFACRKFDGVVGGVEKMSTTLMNEMTKRGHDVTLFTWDDNENAQSFFPINPSVKWYKMAMGNPAEKAGVGLRIKRARKVRNILKTIMPDVVLGFQEGSFVSLKIYGLGLNIPMVCAIRESPFRYAHIKSSPPFWLTCQLFRLSPAITVQFDRYRMGFPKFLRHKIFSIPNHIEPETSQGDPVGADVSEKIILSTGRLSPEKNHAALISAFATIADKHPDWKLIIMGKGGQHAELQKQAQSLPSPIAQRIQIEGPSQDVSSWLKKCQIYCQSSKWEGFPNSILEAMANGIPSVGYRGSDGVCDLIEEGVTGLLADGNGNINTLAAALDTLMSDKEMRQTMGKNAHEISKRYAPSLIFDQWETLLKKVSKS